MKKTKKTGIFRITMYNTDNTFNNKNNKIENIYK